MHPVSTATIASDRTAGAERTLVGVQALAGALFFIFLVLHMGNTLLGALGPEAYNGFQRLIRPFYQHPLIEPLLILLPLSAHAIAGVWLHVLRRKRRRKPSLRYRLHTWAGFFLLLVVFGHVAATRGISYMFGIDPEFAGVSFSLWWMPGYFYPYYFLLFMAGLYHATTGLTLLLARSGRPEAARSKNLPALVMIAGALGVSLALMGFGGKLFDITDPRDNDYARQYSKMLDIDLSRTTE